MSCSFHSERSPTEVTSHIGASAGPGTALARDPLTFEVKGSYADPDADTTGLRAAFQEALFSGSHEEQRQLIEDVFTL